jgi:hypothetical protein
LDLKWSTEPPGDRLGQCNVKASVRRATMVRRERRQIFIEADFKNIVGAGSRRRRSGYKQSCHR